VLFEKIYDFLFEHSFLFKKEKYINMSVSVIVFMWPSIILIVLLMTVFVLLFSAFMFVFAIIALNFVILYTIYLRVTTEFKKFRVYYYLGMFLSLLTLFLFGNWLPLWVVTTFVLQSFVFAQVLRLIEKVYSDEFKRKKR